MQRLLRQTINFFLFAAATGFILHFNPSSHLVLGRTLLQESAGFSAGQKVDVNIKDQWLAGEISWKDIKAKKYLVAYLTVEGYSRSSTFGSDQIRERGPESPAAFPDTVFYKETTYRKWIEQDYSNAPESMRKQLENTTYIPVCRTGSHIHFRSESGYAGSNVSSLTAENKAYLDQLETFTAEEVGEAPGVTALTYRILHSGTHVLNEAKKKLGPAKPLQFSKSKVSFKSGGWKFELGEVPNIPIVDQRVLVQARTIESNERTRQRAQQTSQGRPSGFPGNFPGASGFPPAGGFGPQRDFDGTLVDASISNDGKDFSLLLEDRFSGRSFYQSTVLANNQSFGEFSGAKTFATDSNGQSIFQAQMANLNGPAARGLYSTFEIISLRSGKHYKIPRQAIGNSPSVTAKFINEKLLCIAGDQLTVVSLSSGRAYQTDKLPSSFNGFTTSPDQKHIAINAENGVLIFNVANGKSVGFLAAKNFNTCQSAFSPDGSKIAIISGSQRKVALFDLIDKQKTKEFSTSTGHVRLTAWCHENFLLVGSDLYHLETELPVWQFLSGINGTQHLHGSQFAFADENSCQLFEIPHVDLNSKMQRVNLASATKLQVGASVAVQAGSSTYRQMNFSGAVEKMKKQLIERGFKVDDNSSNVLKIYVQQMPAETIEVETEGDTRSRNGETHIERIRCLPTRSVIELEKNGSRVWVYETINKPGGGIGRKNGESLQQAVNRLCQPNMNFFHIPFGNRLVLLEGNKFQLGRSIISVSGVLDQ